MINHNHELIENFIIYNHPKFNGLLKNLNVCIGSTYDNSIIWYKYGDYGIASINEWNNSITINVGNIYKILYDDDSITKLELYDFGSYRNFLRNYKFKKILDKLK